VAGLADTDFHDTGRIAHTHVYHTARDAYTDLYLYPS
jgi:hypothetical protein